MSGSNTTVLLVEDTPGDVRLLQALLARSPGRYDVIHAACLRDALARLKDASIDLVLLDLGLPDSQGIDTLYRLRAQAARHPIVVLTALDDETLGHLALQAGAQDYLLKGQVDAAELDRSIRHAMERQHMHLALQASEARLRNLIAHNGDVMVVVDHEGMIRFVNLSAEALFACPAADLVGTPFGFPTRAGETTEIEFINTCGKAVVAEMRVVKTEWDGEQAYLASLRDITERRKAEDTLRHRDEQLRQAQKMEAIGRLAGGVAHDFNNLLTAIIGYSDIMLLRLHKSDKLYRYVEQISKAANRAALLTRQLLAFSRRQIIQPRVVHLNGIVVEMERMLQPLIGENIHLLTDLSPHLGHVKADPGHLQQLIMNLVVNARDAMPEGGTVRIETANVELTEADTGRYLGAPPGPYVRLSVHDTGTGIDAETRLHLFEPFFTTKEVGKGTGLGLAVIYGILQQVGGDVEVISAEGCGATFHIYLPRVMGLQPPHLTADTSPTPSGLETVLLVEDEEIVRVLIRDTLQLNGYRVLEAKDTLEALRLCRQYADRIHLLVTDVIMPGLSGSELADRLRALRPEMRVLFISGYGQEAVARYGVADSGSAFLRKPFTPERLARKVREVLDTPSFIDECGL